MAERANEQTRIGHVAAGTELGDHEGCGGSIVTLSGMHATGANAVCERCGAFYAARLRAVLTPVVPEPHLEERIRIDVLLAPGETHLARLRRCLRLRNDHRNELSDVGLRFMDRAIFAALTDCVDAGQGDEAREALARAKVRVGSLPAGRGRA